MARLHWHTDASPYYESGLDHGVLYVGNRPGVAWNGLIALAERPVGGVAEPFYIDGVKYLNHPTTEEFSATLEAFSSPKEFDICDGTAFVNSAVQIHRQLRQSFGLSYRTRTPTGHKIHLIYEAMAHPTARAYPSLSDSPEASTLAWSLSTQGVATTGHQAVSTITLDPGEIEESIFLDLERWLYGTDNTNPRLPSPNEILALFQTIQFAPAMAGLAFSGVTWAGLNQSTFTLGDGS